MLSWWVPAFGQSWCRAIPILLMSELIDSLGMPPHQPRTEVCSSSKEKMCFAFKIRLRVKNGIRASVEMREGHVFVWPIDTQVNLVTWFFYGAATFLPTGILCSLCPVVEHHADVWASSGLKARFQDMMMDRQQTGPKDGQRLLFFSINPITFLSIFIYWYLCPKPLSCRRVSNFWTRKCKYFGHTRK